MARTLVASVLLVSGGAELFDMHGFRRSLDDYAVPKPLHPILARALPVAELVLAFAMLTEFALPISSIVAAALLITFSVGIGVRIVRGDLRDCHCFGGALREKVSTWTLLRTLLLALGSLATAAWYGRPVSFQPRVDVAELVPAVLITAAVFLIYAQLIRVLGLEAAEDTGQSTLAEVKA